MSAAPPAPTAAAPTRVRRTMVLLGAGAAGAVVAVALWLAFGAAPAPPRPAAPPAHAAVVRPLGLEGVPRDYSSLAPPPAGPPPAPALAAVQPAALSAPAAPARPAARADPAALAHARALAAEQEAALRAPVFFADSHGSGATAGLAAPGLAAVAAPGPAGGAGGPPPGHPAGSGGDQAARQAFLEQSRQRDPYLAAPLLAPAAPLELKAGTVIPAALLTAVNSDLPGDVLAQVTENVYDTVSGRARLIPQGARLLGRYDSQITAGQRRAQVVWQRLLFPNGTSLGLDGMPATDPAGAAGLADQVDDHLRDRAIGLGLATAVSFLGNLARGAPQERSLLYDLGDTTAQEAARVGSTIVERHLNIPPTLTLRPGFPLRVLVNRDIILPMYPP